MAWGVSLSYDAGLYYRNIDPRPRNTTGTLTSMQAWLCAHGPTTISACREHIEKYRQTCDLMFMRAKREKPRVYHLTGLGNHYARFAGTGYSNYYDGERHLARVTLVRALAYRPKCRRRIFPGSCSTISPKTLTVYLWPRPGTTRPGCTSHGVTPEKATHGDKDRGDL